MMRVLVEGGADPKMPTKFGVTPLMAAACLDYYEGETAGPFSGVSEAELLIPYGPTRFASKAGQLAGNHFLTLEVDPVELAELGRGVLWNGAVDVSFEIRS